MSSFLESIKEHFDTSDLYQALGVDKGADDTELKKAYRRLSLKVHPDRVSADEVAVATKKFQVNNMATPDAGVLSTYCRCWGRSTVFYQIRTSVQYMMKTGRWTKRTAVCSDKTWTGLISGECCSESPLRSAHSWERPF